MTILQERNKLFDALTALTDGQACWLIDRGRIATTGLDLTFQRATELFGMKWATDRWAEDDDGSGDVIVCEPKHFTGHIITLQPLVIRSPNGSAVTGDMGWREAAVWAEVRGFGEEVSGVLYELPYGVQYN